MITAERQAVTLHDSGDATTEVAAIPGPARLLHGDLSQTTSLVSHRRQYPQPPPLGGVPWKVLGRLVAEAGLAGRGGAAFPTGRKIAAVAERGGWTVVANGAEGEPASRKDRLLMTLRPHLVLDGAMLAAAGIGAGGVVICISRDEPKVLATMNAAVGERAAAGEAIGGVRVVDTPPRYVAGEETALVRFINGGPAKPAGAARRPFERGVKNRPTLVQNVETLANLALIVEHGPAWYRSCGTRDEPGTRLVTVSAAGRHLVLEAECGTPVSQLLGAAGIEGEAVQAVLVGGLFGTWLSGAAVAGGARLSRSDLARFGANPGAGLLVPVPWDACGIGETARILRWYAGESAAQCGPCRFGLPDLASVVADAGAGRAPSGALEVIDRFSENIDGRGACRHPDGAVRLLRSARTVFADDFARHLSGQPCPFSRTRRIDVPVPSKGWR